MLAEARKSPQAAGRSLAWPIPPYFRAASAQDDAAPACIVRLVNDRQIYGDLLGIGDDTLAVRPAAQGGGDVHALSLDQVRLVRLLAPLLVTRHADVMAHVGVDDAHEHERRFRLTFTDGRNLAGTTLGFVKDANGLFLFQREGAGQQVIRSFVPARQLKDVQIGPLLGETLARRQSVTEQALAAALGQQARLRDEKLGAQLLDHGIVSQQALTHALEAQRRRPSMKLGELLRESGLLTDRQLSEALAIQEKNRERRLGDILVDMGVVTIRQVQRALSEKLGIPFVDVREFSIDPSALELVSPAFASMHQALPLLHFGDALVVAVENPLAMDFVQELRFVTGRSVVPVIADPVELRQRIVREYAGHDVDPPRGDSDVPAPGLAAVRVQDLASELARQAPGPEQRHDPDSDARITDNALVRLVNKIIVDAHEQGASDIHIESNSGTRNTRIRFRKDGDLEDYLELQPAYRSALVSRIKIMAGLDISEHRHAQDGKIAFGRFGPVPIDLRVAVVPTADNLEDVVMRLLGGVEPLPLPALGLCARDLEQLQAMVTRSYGLILVCGPTGSGKTTTLHSVLHHINRPDIKIWTAEDPVEIAQPGLRQVQINARIGWTFANAMRAFLRADPDVIMVGEMRDEETAKIAIEASLTGHLVLSTLHTNSAAESVVRLLDLGMDPFNFADALIGVLSQRLARRLCPKCRRARPADADELHALAQEYCAGTGQVAGAVVARWQAKYGGTDAVHLYEPGGCELCNDGYKGRVGLYELLGATEDVRHLIRTRGAVPQIQAAGLAGGMQLLRQDAIGKVLGGALDLASARAAFG